MYWSVGGDFMHTNLYISFESISYNGAHRVHVMINDQQVWNNACQLLSFLKIASLFVEDPPDLGVQTVGRTKVFQNSKVLVLSLRSISNKSIFLHFTLFLNIFLFSVGGKLFTCCQNPSLRQPQSSPGLAYQADSQLRVTASPDCRVVDQHNREIPWVGWTPVTIQTVQSLTCSPYNSNDRPWNTTSKLTSALTLAIIMAPSHH